MEKIILKILSRIKLEENNNTCWLYPKYLKSNVIYNHNSYANINNKPIHIVMWEYYKGPIKKNHIIHHKCLTKNCCNIWHLQELTPEQHSFTHHNVMCHIKIDDNKIFCVFNPEEYSKITNKKKEIVRDKITKRLTKNAKFIPNYLGNYLRYELTE